MIFFLYIKNHISLLYFKKINLWFFFNISLKYKILINRFQPNQSDKQNKLSLSNTAKK